MKYFLPLLCVVALSSCTPETTDQLIDALARVPEIQARTVVVNINHGVPSICVSGVLRNIGGNDIQGPFKVAIGITRYTVYPPGPGIPPVIFSEELVEVPPDVTIAKNGGEYQTDCSTRELVYRDQDPNAVYEFEILADVEDVIDEFDDWGNNRFKTKWWTVSPGIETPFRIEKGLDKAVD